MSDASAAHTGWLRHVSALSRHRYSVWALAAIAYVDSAFLPIPPDLLLVPMILIGRERTAILLLICTVASALGAGTGYLIGYALWSAIGAPLVQVYGYVDAFEMYQRLVHEWGFWIIIGKAFTPIPFMIAAIAAGVAAMPLLPFMIAVTLARGFHFVMVGGLLALFGPRMLAMAARYERPFAIVTVIVLIGLVVAYHLR